MKRRADGRGVDRLLADFGHDLPTRPAAPIEAAEPRLFGSAHPRGQMIAEAGWSPAKAPVSVWKMTSDQAPVLWPFVTSPGLPPTGAIPSSTSRKHLLRDTVVILLC